MVYGMLFNQLTPSACDMASLEAATKEERAEMVIAAAKDMSCLKFITAQEILQVSYVTQSSQPCFSSIFCCCCGLIIGVAVPVSVTH